MTYKEAIRLKAKQLSLFEEDGIEYKVFVTPENNYDLKRYLRDIRGFYCQLTDNVAKRYSKDGRFILRGLCYKNRGDSIIYVPVEIFGI